MFENSLFFRSVFFEQGFVSLQLIDTRISLHLHEVTCEAEPVSLEVKDSASLER